MNNPETADAALTPYRVLDLTEGGFNWCGRVLADLGADVIKVEPPGGSPTRLRGPFYQDRADSEHSLFWHSYCLNKRSVTLDLESTAGQSRFRELAAASDIVLESAEPGYLDGLGLGYEAAIQYLSPAIADYVVNGRVAGRTGNTDEVYAPHGVSRCKDETRSMTGPDESWCAIAVTSDEEWGALCRVMGGPTWSQETRFSTMDSRRANSETLDELLGQWTSGYEAHEVMRILQEAGVPAGAVQSQSDLWEDPQLKHRGFFQWLDHTECGPMPYDGLQFRLSKTPGKLRMPHALVGEHNELILKEWLKLSDDEIADLVVAEALEVS